MKASRSGPRIRAACLPGVIVCTVLVASAMTVGCNAVLGIDEAELCAGATCGDAGALPVLGVDIGRGTPGGAMPTGLQSDGVADPRGVDAGLPDGSVNPTSMANASGSNASGMGGSGSTGNGSGSGNGGTGGSSGMSMNGSGDNSGSGSDNSGRGDDDDDDDDDD